MVDKDLYRDHTVEMCTKTGLLTNKSLKEVILGVFIEAT